MGGTKVNERSYMSAKGVSEVLWATTYCLYFPGFPWRENDTWPCVMVWVGF